MFANYKQSYGSYIWHFIFLNGDDVKKLFIIIILIFLFPLNANATEIKQDSKINDYFQNLEVDRLYKEIPQRTADDLSELNMDNISSKSITNFDFSDFGRIILMHFTKGFKNLRHVVSV